MCLMKSTIINNRYTEPAFGIGKANKCFAFAGQQHENGAPIY